MIAGIERQSRRFQLKIVSKVLPGIFGAVFFRSGADLRKYLI
jgi:hypothetical protein